MGVVSGIVVFMMTWWTLIFCVLPFGLKRDETGKPDDPKLKKKIIITTILSAVLWVIIFLLVQSNLISFRVMSEHVFPQ